MISQRPPIVSIVTVLLLILSAGILGQAGCSPQIKRPQKITIGANVIGTNALLYIAKNQGYDRAQGLEMTIKPFQAGRDAVREVRAGRLDLACCAEFVLVNEIFAGADNLRCLTVLSSGDIHALIARRDKGISRPGDLKGKAIGVAKGTSGEFFLGRFLTFNDISLKEVTVVDLNPFDLAGALKTGRVDAVLGWEPLTYDIVKQAGDNAIEWPVQEGQDFYWLLVTREDVIQNQREKLEKLLRALSQAVEFVHEHPKAAMTIIAQWTKVPLTDLQAGKYPTRYKLFLDQGLLLAMEDQARWMIRNNLSGQHARVPNYLGFMQVEALSRANPLAVNLVVPTEQK